MNQLDNTDDLKILFALTRGLILIALLVAVVVSTLVLANYFQRLKVDPLNSTALTQLNTELREQPRDDLLRQEVRTLHLMARKAYFNSLWQVRIGGILILISLGLFAISLKITNSVKRRLPDPTAYRIAPDFLTFSRGVQNVILATGSVFFLTALVISLLTTSQIPADLEEGSLATLDEAVDLSQQWPSFRGPGGIGHAVHTDVPTDWDGASGRNILWKTVVPREGFSSPIVISDRIFITGGDANIREVFCYKADNGELLWQQTVPNMLPPDSEFDFDYVDPGTGFAAPTMATDGKRVLAIFATGDLVCYTMEGDRAWGRNLGLLDNHYAHSSSLLVHEGLCLVQYDSFNEPRLIAVSIATGAIVWEAERWTISWASPIIVDTGERTELILTDSKSLSSYDPVSGDYHWRVECLSGEVGPSPAYSQGTLFTANEYAKASAVEIHAPGSEPAVEIRWQMEDNLPNTSSPVARGEYLVMATSGGLVSMLNTATGEILWDKYLGSGFYSSPIIVDENVYLMDLKGQMQIFRLADSYERVNVCELGEASSCTPAFMPGRIYIRGETHLYCIARPGS